MLFGGRSGDQGRMNDVYSIDLLTMVHTHDSIVTLARVLACHVHVHDRPLPLYEALPQSSLTASRSNHECDFHKVVKVALVVIQKANCSSAVGLLYDYDCTSFNYYYVDFCLTMVVELLLHRLGVDHICMSGQPP